MSTVSADEIIQSVTVEDVTDDNEKLEIAFMIAASNYIKFSTRSLTIQEVYAELCDDVYHQKGLARTLLITGMSPLTGEVAPLGSFRVVVSPHQNTNIDMPPLEAMSLVTPLEGWEFFQCGKFDPFKSAEISRFALTPECRSEYSRKINLPAVIASRGFEMAKYISENVYGKTQLWGIMLHPVVNLVVSAGLTLLTTTEVTLNHQRHDELFKKYDRYWLNGNPKLYEFALN
ncbi:MAG: hypothetical protein U0175_12650 [Caldilineaceae bacterium]